MYMDETNDDLWNLCESVLTEDRAGRRRTRPFTPTEAKVDRENVPLETHDRFGRAITAYKDYIGIYCGDNRAYYMWTMAGNGAKVAERFNAKFAGRRITMEVAFDGGDPPWRVATDNIREEPLPPEPPPVPQQMELGI